jgi:hypothetical protein
MINWEAIGAGAALLVTANAVVWTALWLAFRIREEFAARAAHVCFIDDDMCPACGCDDRDMWDRLYAIGARS